MTSRREPAVAGQFYPANPSRLESAVRDFLAQVGKPTTAAPPKVLVVPHAGYPYSGPVAASAYALLQPVRKLIKKVVLFGPSHRVHVSGAALCGVDSYDTPLGPIPVDHDFDASLLELPQMCVMPEAHRFEHSLEVQLPFLQVVLESFSLLPFSVGQATPQEIEQILDLVWGGPETLILISSDLSHYYDYETATGLDQRTTRAIEELREQDLDSESACGRIALRGALLAAKHRGLHVETLDLRNSGDTAGSRDQVVGYGAYALR